MFAMSHEEKSKRGPRTRRRLLLVSFILLALVLAVFRFSVNATAGAGW
jgi:hypothetical protein